MPRPVPVPRSRTLQTLTGLSFVIPFAMIFLLVALDVRLGQGYFFHRYSPLRGARTLRSLPMIPIAFAAAGAVWLLASRCMRHRVTGAATLIVCALATGAWVWWAPPKPLTQQMFNLTSPSSDGAFLIESGQVRTVTGYLRDFPQRLHATPEEMGGTRVLSNPPGMTIFAYLVTRNPAKEIGWLERFLIKHEQMAAEDVFLPAATVRLGVALCAVWILAGFAAYGLGRVLLSPAGAAVFAVVATFNPATLHFIPGKDPAQLFTINLMLWAWFAGWKRSSVLLCVIAGATLAFGSMFGLIHIWVALIALIATTWESRQSVRTIVTRNVLHAAGGVACVFAIAWITLDCSIPLTLFAVTRRWSEIQKTFDMNRGLWYVIGLPIFAVFLSSGFWTLLGLSLRRPRFNFGKRLALTTAGVMLFIYLAMGVTYELPRLWVAFLPPLTLGLAAASPLFRGRGEHPRVGKALALLVLAQIVFTTFHWTFFDARESEWRLISQRFYQ